MSAPMSARSRTGPNPLGIVLGSAVNTNGRSAGLTAPHGPTQQALLAMALSSSEGVSPGRVSGLQMHGTGTPLGDPIEVGAAAAILLKVCKD